MKKCVNLEEQVTKEIAGIVLKTEFYCQELRWKMSEQEVKKRCALGECMGYRPRPGVMDNNAD